MPQSFHWKQYADKDTALLGGEPLTSARAPGLHNLTAAFGGHARAVTVTALAYKLARLIGPLHVKFSADRAWRWLKEPQNRQSPELPPGRHTNLRGL